MVADPGAGEVDDGLHARESRGVDRASPRVPAHLVRPGRLAPDEAYDLVPVGAQGVDQGGADEAGRAGDGDAHGDIVARNGPRGVGG